MMAYAERLTFLVVSGILFIMPTAHQHDAELQRRLATFLKERRSAIPVTASSLGSYRRSTHRIGKPVTQQEAADAIRVSRTWYALLEEGGAKTSPALLSRICSAFSLEREESLALFSLAIPELDALIHRPRETSLPHWLSPDTAQNTLPVADIEHIERVERRLSDLRAKFLDGKLDASDAVRPRIMSSWQRCRTANVRRDTRRPPSPLGVTLTSLREASRVVLNAAEPVLASLDEHLGQSGYVVVLANSEGVIIDFRGDAEVQRRVYEDDPEYGGDASESAIGTSAVGTSLADGRAIHLLGAEHYSDGLQSCFGTAAPIRYPATSNFAGVLLVGGDYHLIRPHLLGLVVQGALEIEERLAFSPWVA